ncbi:unnamed protein product [Kuraishia capsulata CBS 1993]|uniref:histone acetyltransferase n=1 Tax=Kuraishia capsulata CBS 1993 TaxID=1382522 RepID=W6MHG3_9ASCO|nr:uncharacterized protein KUCA_T00001664001 [Kuraishia capsulata CBS 1993]CDK25694.1 unnamed protein product [Kuraishia capsulata CBS 1993]
MPKRFTELLAEITPKANCKYSVVNVRSSARETKPLVSAPSRSERPRTLKIEHLIVVCQDGIPFFALEVYVYLSLYNDRVERLVFVSKADTTGLLSKRGGDGIKIKDIVKVALKWILKYPIETYVESAHLKRRQADADSVHTEVSPELCHTYQSATQRVLHALVVKARGLSKPKPVKPQNKDLVVPKNQITKLCLFTRAEPQYLFPGSDQNHSKHVLSGDKLLKWWADIVDGLVAETFSEIDQLKINIPGAEPRTVERTFGKTGSWKVGDIFSANNASSSDLAVHRIPLLPDDPKGRFLEHLVVENRIKKVSISQFWVELAIRQEFRLGITVGVIGAVGKVRPSEGIYTTEVALTKAELQNVKDLLIERDYSDVSSAKEFSERVSQDERISLEFFTGNREPSKAVNQPNAETQVNAVLTVRKRPKSEQVNSLNNFIRKKPKN